MTRPTGDGRCPRPSTDGPILEIKNLSISFFTRLREIPAVMDFSCTVHAGRGDGAGRRVRLRQVDRGAGGDARSRQERPHRRRLDQVQGPRPDHTCPTRSCARSAAREIAMIYQEPMASPEPGDEDRRAADGSADDPRGHVGGRGRGAGAADGRRRQAARPRAHPRRLSAPAVRRPAAAHRHRHGADVETRAADPRRADHRARRDGRGRDRRSGQGSRRQIRHLDAVHLAQPRAGARRLRPASA